MIPVLHTIDTTGPGGAQQVFLSLIRLLPPARFSAVPVVSGKVWVYHQLERSGISAEIVPSKGSYSFLYLWRLLRIVKHHRIRIIHSHLLGPNTYCSILGLMLGVPVISTFHGLVDMEGDLSRDKKKIFLIERGSRKIVFVSNYLRDTFVKRYAIRPEKTTVIYNGIDLAGFTMSGEGNLRHDMGFGSDVKLVGAVGNIRRAKGYDVLVEVAKQVVADERNVVFLVIGEGDSEVLGFLKRNIREYGLDRHFRFLGFRNDVPQVLKSLDVFVATSESEGFSIATVEAMAAGIPVISTRSGGPEEIITHEYDGILVPKGDVTRIKEEILRLLNGQDKRRSLIRNAKKTACASFSNERMIENYLSLYRESIKHTER